VRLLVAAAGGRRAVEPLASETFMARLGRATGPDGRIDPAKIDEVADVVAAYVEQAAELGVEGVRVLGTAAAREAANGEELAEAIRRRAGVPLEIVDEDEEARLAFVGALSAVEEPWDGDVGVVDVGGGSTEIVVGSLSGGISWARSFRVGSGRLTDRFLAHDPPRRFELERARELIDATLPRPGVIPQVQHAVASGGSASGLRRLVGPLLDDEALSRALRLVAERPSLTVARQFGVDPARARLLAGGALLLQAASVRLGSALWSCRAGIREGAILDLSAARST
jgi:exopolyphosphatase/guanosine-5'-triphosphate,3'-diphosphate pyrophosphatase